MAFEDARESVAHFRAGAPDRDRARDVGRAVLILAAAVDQENAAPDTQVGRLAHAIMRDRGIGSGGGDGRKRNVLQRARLAPKCLQRLRARRFRSSLPLGASRSNQARKRATAAPSRKCAARAPSSSILFLAAFISAIGSAADVRFAARRLQRLASRAGAVAASKASRFPSAPSASRSRDQAIGLRDIGKVGQIMRARCSTACARRHRASACPAAGTMAKLSGKGVCATSAPRMLNSQATS